MRLTPLDIYQQEFKTVLRGLDPDAVEDFLGRVADDYEHVIKENEEMEMKCPKCGAEDFERVMSTTSYAMGSSGAGQPAGGQSVQTRQCSGGSCSTLTLPGHSKD